VSAPRLINVLNLQRLPSRKLSIRYKLQRKVWNDYRTQMRRVLTLCHMGTAVKHHVPVCQTVIFDIRTLWRSPLSVSVSGCQKLHITA